MKPNPEYAMMKKGDVFILERGHYSDRDWSALRALVDFDIALAAMAYKEHIPVDEYGYADYHPSFHAWLVQNGWAEDAKDVRSFHCGSYGQFDPDWL